VAGAPESSEDPHALKAAIAAEETIAQKTFQDFMGYLK
jgi:hypothetical protein